MYSKVVAVQNVEIIWYKDFLVQSHHKLCFIEENVKKMGMQNTAIHLTLLRKSSQNIHLVKGYHKK